MLPIKPSWWVGAGPAYRGHVTRKAPRTGVKSQKSRTARENRNRPLPADPRPADTDTHRRISVANKTV